MTRQLFVSSISFFLAWTASAQAPAIEWKKCFGGTNTETQRPVVQQTSDGGTIMATGTLSNDGDVSGYHGGAGADVWVVKLNASGAIQWQKAIGGTDVDWAVSIEEADDGGFFAAGLTLSSDGDVAGYHGGGDLWAAKLSAAGDLLWLKPLGGSAAEDDPISVNDYLWPLILAVTSDGGCVVTGTTYSNDGDVSGYHGAGDVWVVKLDANGTIQWQNALGGSGFDEPVTTRATSDGGAVVVGHTASSDGDVSGFHGEDDLWAVKLSAVGTIQWTKALGGSADEFGHDIQQTMDGGYIIAGATWSTDGDVTGFNGTFDWWVVKLDAAGVLQWQHALGGPDGETMPAVRQTDDGGYLVAGTTYSGDAGDVVGYHGTLWDTWHDGWVVKLDAGGTIQWQKCLGGSSEDETFSFQKTIDGGCVVLGWSSSNDGDVTGNHGSQDLWVAKLSASGALQWQKSLGSILVDRPSMMLTTSDGGYLVAGWVNAGDGNVAGSGYHGGGDAWLVKFASDGTGIEEHTDQDFVIAPVPASDELHITCTVPLHSARITLTDELGRDMMRAPMNGVAQTLNVGNLPRGLYMFTLRTEKGNLTQRVVLE